MDYPTLTTATLGDVDESFYYGVECRSCLRRVRLSLLRLRAQLGPDYPLKNVRTRLKCSTCHSRDIIIAYYTPAHAGSAMHERFLEKPV